VALPWLLHGPQAALLGGIAYTITQSIVLSATFAVSHNVSESKPLEKGQTQVCGFVWHCGGVCACKARCVHVRPGVCMSGQVCACKARLEASDLAGGCEGRVRRGFLVQWKVEVQTVM
jgi:hypothetical protein